MWSLKQMVYAMAPWGMKWQDEFFVAHCLLVKALLFIFFNFQRLCLSWGKEEIQGSTYES